MNCTRSGVSTTIPALPEKFVRYNTFDRDVTISASTEARAQASRRASCRRLSAALGACDMDGGQELFEGLDGGASADGFWIRLRNRGRSRRSGRMDKELLRGLLERQALRRVRRRLGFHLARQ